MPSWFILCNVLDTVSIISKYEDIQEQRLCIDKTQLVFNENLIYLLCIRMDNLRETDLAKTKGKDLVLLKARQKVKLMVQMTEAMKVHLLEG